MDKVMTEIEETAEIEEAPGFILKYGANSYLFSQKDFIQSKGIRTSIIDSRLGFYSEEDMKRALTLLWENKISGWFYYINEISKLGICSEEEATSFLESEVKSISVKGLKKKGDK